MRIPVRIHGLLKVEEKGKKRIQRQISGEVWRDQTIAILVKEWNPSLISIKECRKE